MIEHCIGSTGIAELHIKFANRNELNVRVKKGQVNGNIECVN